MATEIVVTPDRFIIFRDDDTLTVTGDRKKAEQIARHFKRLQPASKIIVRDRTTDESEEL